MTGPLTCGQLQDDEELQSPSEAQSQLGEAELICLSHLTMLPMINVWLPGTTRQH